jgi:uncharacterized protein YkwD
LNQNGALQWQKNWVSAALSNGVHTLRFVHASGAMVDLDAISIFDTTYQNQVITLINQQRASRGLPALSTNALLTNAATTHTVDMASNNFFSHTGSDGSQPGDRITAAGYNWITWGETIAAGYQTPADVVNAWMQSQGHSEILLSTDYEDVGIGYISLSGTTYGSYWTAVFGAR